jgi:glutamine synthetase
MYSPQPMEDDLTVDQQAPVATGGESGHLNTPDAVSKMRQTLTAGGVEYIAAVWTDTYGRSKAKIVPAGGFDKALEGRGPLYGVHAIDGMGHYGAAHPDQSVVPDLDSLIIAPWDERVAWFAGDIHWVDGSEYPLCSRAALKRQVDRAAGLGLEFKVGIEPEFYVYREDENGDLQPLNGDDVGQSWAYDVEMTLGSLDFLGEVTQGLTGLGWDVGALVHEGGVSQFEIDYGYDSVLKTADRWVFVKVLLREIAKRHGGFVTFMPKPTNSAMRSGLHYNMSLWGADGENAFASSDDPRGYGLSPLAYQFIAGQLEHAAAITAVTCPTVNSYRGLILNSAVGGISDDKSWAPVVVSYGPNNRSAMLRVPDGRSCVENRATDPSCNIYLGLAMSLAAGLDGIERELEAPEPYTSSAYGGSEAELQAGGLPLLPRTLQEAINAFDADPLGREALGPELAQVYVELKRAEWDDYLGHVSDWDRDRYLRQF